MDELEESRLMAFLFFCVKIKFSTVLMSLWHTFQSSIIFVEPIKTL